MKISRLLCQRFLPQDILPAAELAAALTARGLEVENVTRTARAQNLVAGEITAVSPHPQADKLKLCTVDIGGDAPLQVVCGAPNARPGLRVAVAVAGRTSLDGKVLQAREIRGVASPGMLCSAAELQLGEERGGVLELTAGEGAAGDALDDTLLLNDDILEVNITPNRGDCLSHLGIAREVAAWQGCGATPPQLPVHSDDAADTFPMHIDEAARGACPFYGGVVMRDVHCDRPLPWRWRTVLERCGARPVSAVVDITNYLMFLYGQPLHAFDLDKLRDGIRVRFAAEGEPLALLDGTPATCTADTLLIADAAGNPLALGGVMGGAASAIFAQSKNILLEAAHFAPEVVAGRTRQFKINSEAAFRFERGVDAHLPPLALAQAAAHIRQACGGRIGKLIGSCGAPPPPAKSISLPARRIGKVLGVDIPAADAVAGLNALAVPATLKQAKDGEKIEVQPPSWRFDLTIAEDVMEEIVRLHGYDNLPETLPAETGALRPPARTAADAARAFFCARGWMEVITYAFVSPAWEAALSPVPPQPLANPMSEEMCVMRTTLWGGLIDRALYNLRRRQERVWLFETGRCFLPPATSGELPVQPAQVAGIICGQRLPTQWAADTDTADFYDLKGMLEEFLSASNAVAAVEFKPADSTRQPALHPGQSAEVFVDGEVAGALGALHPQNQLAQEFKTPPLLFSLSLDALAQVQTQQPAAAAHLSRLPPVWRDLALVADAALPVGQLLAAARAAAPAPPVLEVQLFDFFLGDGKRLPAGKKSCGLRFLLQGRDATLTGEEIEGVMAKVLAALRTQCGVELRESTAA